MNSIEHFEKLGAVADILKKRFPNLTVKEVLKLASDILQAVL